MIVRLAIVLVIVYTCHVNNAYSAETFHGHKVLDIKTKTVEDVRAIIELEHELELDFWKIPKYDTDSLHVRVSPHKLDELIAKLEELNADVSVWIHDLQTLIDNEPKQTLRSSTSREFPFNQYHTFPEIEDYVYNLAGTTGDLSVYVGTLNGSTAEGRTIPYVKISRNPAEANKKAIFMDCGIHAREWISPAFCVYVINQLVTDQYKITLDLFDWYIVPVLNPDGYQYSHDNNRMWRKNRLRNDGSSCLGVDLNRNFGFQYDASNGGSLNPCSDIYVGTGAFSEKESNAVRQFIEERKEDIAAYLTIHSYGQMWLYPWGYTKQPAPTDALLSEVAIASVAALRVPHGTTYVYGSAARILYASAGGSDDWAYGDAQIPFSYTLELRDTGSYGFVLPENQILPTCDETWEGLKTMANVIHAYTSQ